MNNLIGLFLAFFPLLAITLIASFKLILWLFYGEIVDIIKCFIKYDVREVINETYDLHENLYFFRITSAFKQAIREVYEENKNR